MQIKWHNRFIDDNGSTCLVSVDGTDFKIWEPSPFDDKWYSHKLNHGGLRYEIAVCIQTGWIVWVNGPFAPGDWPDLEIARDGICHELDYGEKFLADGTYAGAEGYSETPTGIMNPDQYMKQKARSLHEAVNGRFKMFGALSRTFRHRRHLHSQVFMAVANLVQASIMLDGPPFRVDYNDNYNA